jgi:hypothetical protein
MTHPGTILLAEAEAVCLRPGRLAPRDRLAECALTVRLWSSGLPALAAAARIEALIAGGKL